MAVASAARLEQICIDLSAFHLDDAMALRDAGVAIRCHAYNPADMEDVRASCLTWQLDLLQRLRDGLIDSLSGDDVTWCAEMVAEPAAGVHRGSRMMM